MLFSPGAVDEPHKFDLTVQLLRLTFPFLLFVSLTALAGGALNSFHRFGVAGADAGDPEPVHDRRRAVARRRCCRRADPGAGLGDLRRRAWCSCCSCCRSWRSWTCSRCRRWGWRHPDVRKVMRLMVPTLFGSSVAQINLLLDTVIASLLVAGSQTWLSQADRFLELPLGVFGIALGTVILPTLSRHHVNTDHAGFSNALDWGLRTTLMIAVPAMLGLMLLSQPLVATLFQHGQLHAHSTRDMAALSVFGLSFGLPAFALVKVVAAGVLRAPGHEDAGACGRGVADRQHGVQRPVPRRSCIVLWVPAAICSRAGAGRAGEARRACISRWAWPARWPATSTWHCCGAGCGEAGVYERQPGWGTFLLRLRRRARDGGCGAAGPALARPDFTPSRRCDADRSGSACWWCGGVLVYLVAMLRWLPPARSARALRRGPRGYTSGFNEQAVP